MLYRSANAKTAADYLAEAALHKKAIKSSWVTFFKSGVFTVAAAVAVIFGSTAWFANNTQTSAGGTTVQAKAPLSLYIEAGDLTSNDGYQSSYRYTSSVTSSGLSGNLYPISMQGTKSAITDWWYVSGWEGAYAATYTNASPQPCTEAGQTDRYNYTISGDDTVYTAYNMAEYTLYTGGDGTMDVYFAPSSGIEISQEGSSAKQLTRALRVGLVVNDELQFVYAPAETPEATYTGNSKGTTSGFYMVSGANSVSRPDYTVLTDISDYQARVDDNGEFTAGATRFCTASHSGTVIQLVVWLEGTDSEAVIGKSNEADGVSVNLHLVGISQGAA